MMMRIRGAGFGLFVFAVAANALAADPVPEEKLPQAPQARHFLVSRLPDQELNLGGTLAALDSEHTVLYHQDFGGGGATIGFLFGLTGVIVNAAIVSHRTEREAASINGMLSLKLVELLTELADADETDASNTPPVSLSPLLRLVATQGGSLLFGCELVVKETKDGSPSASRYLVVLPFDMPRAELMYGISEDRRAEIAGRARGGFEKAFALYRADRGGKLLSQSEVSFKSTYMSPRDDLPFKATRVGDPEEPGLTVRIRNLVIALPREDIELL